MKRILLLILFSILVLFLFDRLGAFLMKSITADSHGQKVYYLANETKDDIILIGNSRSNNNYVSSILRDTLGKSVYNAGINGSGIVSHYLALNVILKHHRPKLVVLEINEASFYKSWLYYPKISLYTPFIGENKEVDSVFNSINELWKYKLFHLLKYNGHATTNILYFISGKDFDTDYGYTKIPSKSVDVSKLSYDDDLVELDTIKIEYFKKFIAKCRANKVPLVLTTAPVYKENFLLPYQKLKELVTEFDLTIFDYSTSEIFVGKSEYFNDLTHMVDEGARKFTSIFSHDLKLYLDTIQTSSCFLVGD